MRKCCETCKYDDPDYPCYPHKAPCNDCETGMGSDTPTKWEPAEHYEPDTNADRIRAMSDEELARFLAENEWECETYNDCAKCPRMTDDGCVSLSKWLKQPAEE